MLKFEHFVCNPVFRENCWIVYEDGKAVLLDPGFTNDAEYAPFEKFMREENLSLEAIFITHGHFDHLFGVNRCLDAFGDIPIYMHPEDRILIDMAVEMAAPYGERPEISFDSIDVTDGSVVPALGREWQVIATPGHTRGGICWYCESEKVIFSGDTLFAGTIGRTDLYGGDYDQLIVSIMDRLMGLDGDTVLIPGHGHTSTIGDERTHNPFLQPWGEKEPDEMDWDADGIEING